MRKLKPNTWLAAIWPVLALTLLLSWSLPALAQVTLLAADFNDKGLNQPLGTGGAAPGEPVFIDSRLNAIVRRPSPHSNLMALTWKNHDPNYARVRFHWLDNVEIRNGTVTVSFVLMPRAGGGYRVDLRETAGSQKRFGGIYLQPDGPVGVWDDNPSIRWIPEFHWSPGETYLFEWVYDLDAGTYDLSINGTRYVTEHAHGVDMGDRGLGSLWFGILNDSAPESRLDVDDILVTWSGDGIFANDFEGEVFPQ